MEEHLFEVIADTFNISRDSVTWESNRDSIKEWDSLGHIMLMLALEREFGRKLSVQQIETIRSVSDLRDCIFQQL